VEETKYALKIKVCSATPYSHYIFYLLFIVIGNCGFECADKKIYHFSGTVILLSTFTIYCTNHGDHTVRGWVRIN